MSNFQTEEEWAGYCPLLRSLDFLPFEENGERKFLLRDPEGFSDKVLVLSEPVLHILALFDGETSLGEIASRLFQRDDDKLDLEKLVEFVNLFENNHFLDSDNFSSYRTEQMELFQKQPIREMTLAGGAYPEESVELETYLASLFEAGESPSISIESVDASQEKLAGLMLPHIDYQRGGDTYGRGYNELSRFLGEDKDENLLIGIIGVAHAPILSPMSILDKDFDTPWGVVKTEKEIVGTILQKLPFDASSDIWVHRAEHSVELQVIWLRYLLGERNFSILPILAGSFDVFSENGQDPSKSANFQATLRTIKDATADFHGRVLWISSVDMSHIGPQFGDENSIDPEQVKEIESSDFQTLEFVKKVDADGWWNNLIRHDNPRRVCGLNANYLALSLLDGCRGVLVDYDINVSDNKDLLVSFASALFLKNTEKSVG